MTHFITASEADLPADEKLFAANVQKFAPRRSTAIRVVSLCLQCIGGASFLFIAFGLIAVVQS